MDAATRADMSEPQYTDEDRALLARLIDRSGARNLTEATLHLIKTCGPIARAELRNLDAALTELDRLLLPGGDGEAR